MGVISLLAVVGDLVPDGALLDLDPLGEGKDRHLDFPDGQGGASRHLESD